MLRVHGLLPDVLNFSCSMRSEEMILWGKKQKHTSPDENKSATSKNQNKVKHYLVVKGKKKKKRKRIWHTRRCTAKQSFSPCVTGDGGKIHRFSLLLGCLTLHPTHCKQGQIPRTATLHQERNKYNPHLSYKIHERNSKKSLDFCLAQQQTLTSLLCYSCTSKKNVSTEIFNSSFLPEKLTAPALGEVGYWNHQRNSFRAKLLQFGFRN